MLPSAPVFKALTTRQAHLSVKTACADLVRFHPDVSMLTGIAPGAAVDTKAVYATLAREMLPKELAGLLLEAPYEPQEGLEYVMGAEVFEMEHDGTPVVAAAVPAGVEVVPLGDDDVPEMLKLTALTKPGPFSKRTHEMGSYVGIKQDGQLVAMAGERMRIPAAEDGSAPAFSEVSAVCTHPQHTGKGYARLLMSTVMLGIQARGERCFLHVKCENTSALGLYERLGFRSTKILHFAVLRSVL